MSSFPSSRLASVCAALGLLLVAGSARAQFDECGLEPEEVPGAVFDTIFDQASFDFGEVSEKTCKSIVKEGVSTCKAQVKSSGKCFDRALDTNYKISVKQCNELDSSEAREECKAAVKQTRDMGKNEVEGSKNDGLTICDGLFESSLSDSCLGIMKE